jgi:hypothetical protein
MPKQSKKKKPDVKEPSFKNTSREFGRRKAVAKETSFEAAYKQFGDQLVPFEWVQAPKRLVIMTDKKSGARFCECHIKASKLITLGTTDVPLDPSQPEYRANRELVANHAAFAQMKEDAKAGRMFSNIVAEYSKDIAPDHPLKIIGGQHRFEAIRAALDAGVDGYHGVKVYLDLNMDQRLDVQLISNTNIAISSDLYDRMQETFKGPEPRDWSPSVGLLQQGQVFADRGGRGRPLTVRDARTFICNYYRGQDIDPKKFDSSDTTPILCDSGQQDPDWDQLRAIKTGIWADAGLAAAGKEFTKLVTAQRNAFLNSKTKPPVDYPEKALNAAVMAAWAYVAGALSKNATRLQRHSALSSTAGRDPLNASALAKGRHRSDPENYRGLGYRTDAKERGRLVELFWLQAEDGRGITTATIDVAIKKYHAKQAQLEVQKAQARV